MVVRNFTGSKGQSIGASILVTGIPQTGSTVTATKGSKTVNGVWGATIENPEWRGLPSGYTQVKWIGASGSQYINTGLASNQTDKITMKCSVTRASGSHFLFGVYYSGYNYGLNFVDTSAEVDYYYNNGGARGTDVPSASSYDIEFAPSGIVINDINVGSFSSSYTTSATLYLFGANGNTSLKYATTMQMSAFTKSSSADVLQADYVPCKNSNNEYGFYDMVSNTFKGNSGTGSFTGGAEVPQFISAEGYVITPLTEYGEWTVSAISGAGMDKTIVSILAATQYNVALSYDGNYLYKQGYEYPSITNGWGAGQFISAYGGGSASIASNHLTCYTPGLTSVGFYTKNAIDLTNYSAVHFNVTALNHAYAERLTVATSTMTGQTAVVSQDITAAGEYTLNVSSLSSSYYIGFGCWASGSAIQVDKIWLE